MKGFCYGLNVYTESFDSPAKRGAQMYISHATVRDIVLGRLFTEEQEPYLDIIVDLAWMDTLVFAVSFQCRPDVQEAKRQELFRFLAFRWSRPADLADEAKAYVLPRICPDEDRRVTYDDLVAIHLMYGIHAARLNNVTDALVDWVDTAWEHGIRQQRVYLGERNGQVRDASGIVSDLSGILSSFGVARGLLPAA